MDSEKYLELQKKINKGLSPNDEGPYYHHAWWESYKGAVKGKLGGVVSGVILGAIVGGLVAGAMVALPAVALAADLALGVALAFAAAGGMYGAHEFGDIGKVVGAVAATQEQAEARMKSFEAGKFAELKQEIASLKGGASPSAAVAAKPEVKTIDDKNYRTTHYAKVKSNGLNRFVFWKVALVGALVGIAVGALFAATGVAPHLLDGLVGAEGPLSLAKTGISIEAASMTIFGALGASFGINRDIFRQVFDTTDLWFKGIASHDKVREHQVAAGEAIEKKHAQETAAPDIATTVYPAMIDYPASATHYRDRVLADKALLSFDHTRATPQ